MKIVRYYKKLAAKKVCESLLKASELRDEDSRNMALYGEYYMNTFWRQRMELSCLFLEFKAELLIAFFGLK